MVRSEAHSVEDYLKSLTPDRQDAIIKVRKVILDNLPPGYEEIMQSGMIAYVVPLKILPNTYNKQPLQYIALASQKNYMSLYLMGVYGDSLMEAEFRAEYAASGKKLDMGKSCVRFKTIEHLPLKLIGKTIAAVPMNKYIERYKLIKG